MLILDDDVCQCLTCHIHCSPIYGTIVFDTESKALYFCNQMTLVCYIFDSEGNIIEDLVAFFLNRLSDFINVKLFIWITILLFYYYTLITKWTRA